MSSGTCRSYGSSPLTRGARRFGCSDTTPRRLIPAHAGSTVDVIIWGNSLRAHPRSRGEHHRLTMRNSCESGSSPLTRGAPIASFDQDAVVRLIPAHAGSTWGRARRAIPCRAHPRSRGEHYIRLDSAGDWQGSSPLTRGAPIPSGRTRSGPRLIPAHAGSTSCKPTGSMSAWAHPRSRGEHIRPAWPLLRIVGSSPLTRGAPHSANLHTLAVRLIPAHAGSTWG